jgi:hypothetical protein
MTAAIIETDDVAMGNSPLPALESSSLRPSATANQRPTHEADQLSRVGASSIEASSRWGIGSGIRAGERLRLLRTTGSHSDPLANCKG